MEQKTLNTINKSTVNFQLSIDVLFSKIVFSDCSNGSFFSFLNKKCNKCPSSTYQPYTNQTRCLTCNDGKGTINIGAVSEQECIKGNF